MEINIVEKAIAIANVAHKDQLRKSDKSPYIAHPFTVGFKLMQHNFDEAVIAAAIVHDVLEDTEVGEQELREQLGDTVVEIVLGVSEDKHLEWEERKRKYADQISQATESVKAVSIADKIHNLQCMLAAYEEQGPTLWENFSRGIESQVWFAEQMLEAYKNGWNHPLIDEYEKLVVRFRSLV